MSPATAKIRLIAEPRVYLIGHQQIDRLELDRFLNANGSAEWEPTGDSAGADLAEIGGRLCYDSFNTPRPGGNFAYLRRIKEEAHGSVLEHAVYTILITGVSRSLTHELVRHRVGLSPSQLSQRYVDESNVAFVIPPRLVDAYNPDSISEPIHKATPPEMVTAFTDWFFSVQAALDSYRAMTRALMTVPTIAGLGPTAARKAARETAREVLPNCTETKIQITGNARAWRHLIEQRGSAGASAEFRRLAFHLLAKLQVASPNLFGDYGTNLSGPTATIETPHRKI